MKCLFIAVSVGGNLFSQDGCHHSDYYDYLFPSKQEYKFIFLEKDQVFETANTVYGLLARLQITIFDEFSI